MNIQSRRIPERKSILNQMVRQMSSFFNGQAYVTNRKHNYYADFGYPEQLQFDDFYGMYRRSGLARAGVHKTVSKVWQTLPCLQELQPEDRAGKPETKIEEQIRKHFYKIRFWQKLAEADKRSLVGHYGALILRYRDGAKMDQPVKRVAGGIEGLYDVIPCWESQLVPSTWDTDVASPNYGLPTMYTFNESAIGSNKQPRSFQVHPDRVFIWSSDSTLYAEPFLEPGFNSLLTMDKVEGAGGEGFYKNARSNPVLQIDPDTEVQSMADALGVEVEDLPNELDKVVEDWLKGFDRALMLKGIEAKALAITLPSPEHFYNIALQTFSASISIPQKILVGSQTGERASTEDASEWSQTCMSRRSDIVIPNIMALLDRFKAVGLIQDLDWNLDWKSLLDDTPDQMLDRATKMSSINAQQMATGVVVFHPNEIREACGFEALEEDDFFEGPEEDTGEDPAAEGDPSADPEDPEDQGQEDAGSEDPKVDPKDPKASDPKAKDPKQKGKLNG